MSAIVVLDCGATNIRAIAISESGNILASHFIKNETTSDVDNPIFLEWDFNSIWNKLLICCRKVVASIGSEAVVGVTVTTFGVDGAPFDKDGNQIYPIISWKCPRTVPVQEQVKSELDRYKLFEENGIGDYSFNTLYKLKWLKDNKLDIYNKMDKFLFISSMINNKLTGEFTTDITMAGTSMMTNLDDGDWNNNVLNYLNVDKSIFPRMTSAGELIGTLTKDVALSLNLPKLTKVISTGHDTQFALFGSGAGKDQAFLSSGTWEILMSRCNRPELSTSALNNGVTVELDSINGVYNPAIQWLSSAIIEWVGNMFYKDESNSSDLYNIMISEAIGVNTLENPVKINSDFNVDIDDVGKGEISGICLQTSRAHIYRATLESLSEKFKNNFNYINKLCQLSDAPVIAVGGGTKNKLWNQLRANAIQRDIAIVDETEATVIGAAMFGFYGVGQYETIDEAQNAMKPTVTIIHPEKE